MITIEPVPSHAPPDLVCAAQSLFRSYAGLPSRRRPRLPWLRLRALRHRKSSRCPRPIPHMEGVHLRRTPASQIATPAGCIAYRSAPVTEPLPRRRRAHATPSPATRNLFTPYSTCELKRLFVLFRKAPRGRLTPDRRHSTSTLSRRPHPPARHKGSRRVTSGPEPSSTLRTDLHGWGATNPPFRSSLYLEICSSACPQTSCT